MNQTARVLRAIGITVIAATALAGCSTQAAEPSTTLGPDESASISFSFWGNDVRAELYDEAIAEFEKQHENIDVKVIFLAPQDYWEKRQIEAAGGGLPDVITMDLAYLRQYSQNGSLLDLKPYLGKTIATDGLDPQLLGTGVVDGVTTALPLSTNAWSGFVNTSILDDLGVEPFTDGTWDDYYAWMIEVSAAAKTKGEDVWGGIDPTQRFENFELALRAQGKNLFDDDGEPGFDEDDLRDFWSGPADARKSGGIIPQKTVEEVSPLTAFDSAKTASDTTWDNTMSGFLGNLGDGFTLSLMAPPVDVDGAKDLYLKASQMYSIAANSKNPAAAATLIDFLVNSPESGEIFGTNRGLPASKTAIAAAKLDAVSQQIVDYHSSISDRLGEAPPVPIVGFGTLHEKFRGLGEEIGFGTMSVDDAVKQFFDEMDVVLG